ncbi:cytochrome d ubiquinol oxidase subunit II [Sphingomonas sp. CROZ-RG-20F-R02-07]|uniref:cytochrome d ubiquinol oxidase subunit II n=1 Tax=Sphingomonas sp. CROZ-RG-20F-R02-07 TaxID=2914832 RepID=UPI001F57CC49|nr:cytochrome d ubiquinol oxidase subunit II [Sphingomonas sp. CROZ-RG-20F-R02-07]
MIAFWVAVLALTIFLYVTLDGFDLGIGMLLPLAADERQRRGMIATIAPVWDGNETWLVLNAAILFGTFPLTYATILSAFYLPLILMLGALIFRGVSFEFRDKSTRTRPLWDAGFVIGSYLATFLQGVAVGALVHGLPMAGSRYIGGAFGWASPFALLCGVGLCVGYALMGAGWLTFRSPPAVRELGFRLIPRLLAALVLFLIAVFVLALKDDITIMHRWFERPELFAFPALGVAACATLAWAVAKRRGFLPFAAAVVIFAAAFGTLAVSFYPYMIPFAITTTQAAAPLSSLSFMFWGAGVVVLPLTLVYTLVVYFVLKGKTYEAEQGY